MDMEKDGIAMTARAQREIDRQLRRCIEQRVADTGVYRSQHQLLMCMGAHPGCSQAFLAETLGISAAAITTSLQKLEKGGYISRETSADDNRTNYLEVTEKGKAVICKSKQIFRQIEAEMYEGFSVEELECLMNYYERIRTNLERANRESGNKVTGNMEAKR